MNAEQKAEALLHADDRPQSLNDDLYAWAVAAEKLLRTIAAEPQGEPVAWMYTCQKPGNQMKYSSVDDNDTYHWPVDQWNSIVKSALYLHPSLAAEPAPDAKPVAWLGCGECDVSFPCHNGQTKCLRTNEPDDAGPIAWHKGASVCMTCESDASMLKEGWIPLYLHPAPAQTPLTSEPVAWIQPDHLQKARVAPFLCRVEPTKRMSDFVPIFLHPAQTTLTDDDKRDAERYRWLRQSDWTKRGMCVVANSSSVMLGHETLTHERLDAAIDEALKA